jgi:hypothetical protein
VLLGILGLLGLLIGYDLFYVDAITIDIFECGFSSGQYFYFDFEDTIFAVLIICLFELEL